MRLLVDRFPPRIYALRTARWQLDYRPDGWLPFSVRYGHRKWHLLRLGRFGCVTLAPLLTIPQPPTPRSSHL